jgi:hypothetical protein
MAIQDWIRNGCLCYTTKRCFTFTAKGETGEFYFTGNIRIFIKKLNEGYAVVRANAASDLGQQNFKTKAAAQIFLIRYIVFNDY